MRRAVATLALACLAAGCALPALELQKDGEIETEFRSPNPVQSALACIQRTAPQRDHRLMAQTQMSGAEGVALIFVGGYLWGVAVVTPMDAGSRITVRVQSILVGFERDLVASAARGC